MIPDHSGQLADLIVYITSTRVDLFSHQILLPTIQPWQRQIPTPELWPFPHPVKSPTLCRHPRHRPPQGRLEGLHDGRPTVPWLRRRLRGTNKPSMRSGTTSLSHVLSHGAATFLSGWLHSRWHVSVTLAANNTCMYQVFGLLPQSMHWPEGHGVTTAKSSGWQYLWLLIKEMPQNIS